MVVGVIDPSPQVNGRGLDLLRTAGMRVEVAEGPLAHRLKRQNNGLRKTVATGLPFVTYKYAMTLDGRVATDSGDSQWISGADSRALVHQWRAWSDAVVVGAGTVAVDDPRLTARDVECTHQPLRVVVDRHLRLERQSRLVQTLAEGPVLVVCGPSVGEARLAEVASWGIDVAQVRGGADGEVDPKETCRLLASRDVQTVLLEGGPRLAGAWWAAGLIDKLAVFVCPKVVGGVEHRGPLWGRGVSLMAEAALLRELDAQQVGGDLLVTGYTGEPF